MIEWYKTTEAKKQFQIKNTLTLEQVGVLHDICPKNIVDILKVLVVKVSIKHFKVKGYTISPFYLI